MKEIIVNKNEAGQRFDKLLAKYLNEAPKSFLYKMLRKKNITLNDKKAAGNEKLNVGDSIKLYFSDETIEKFSRTNVVYTNCDLDIIYEDSHIMFVNKPVGMLSQKAKETDVSLVEHVISYLLQSEQLNEEDLKSFRPSVCNRLDRNTSGIVVAGKSLVGLQGMGYMFNERTLKKYYRCLVLGKIKEKTYIKGRLIKNESTNKVTIHRDDNSKEGVLIETEYEPIWSNDKYTLLEVHLITGRTHQIRAHLASQNHPIIGDYKYGNRKINDSFKMKYQLESQLLHAYRLEMPELAGELSQLSQRQFVAPLPSKFNEILYAEQRRNNAWEHGTQEVFEDQH